jgi:hypothetical protein
MYCILSIAYQHHHAPASVHICYNLSIVYLISIADVWHVIGVFQLESLRFALDPKLSHDVPSTLGEELDAGGDYYRSRGSGVLFDPFQT